MIAAYEAPAELVRGEIFNVAALELPDPRAGDARRRARSQLARQHGEARGGSGADARRATTSARTRSSRRTLGFIPRALGAGGGDRHARADRSAPTAAMLTDPRHYNIRWLELMSELKPQLRALRHRPVSAAHADHGRRRPARLRPRRTARPTAPVALSHAELDIADADARRRAPFDERAARRRLQLRRVPQRRRLRDASPTRRGRSTCARCASVWRSSAAGTARSSSTSRPTTSSTGAAPSRTARTTFRTRARSTR